MEYRAVLIGLTLNFAIVQISSFKFGDTGKFYLVNEGFFPRKFENEIFKYETCIEPLSENYLDKRIFGIFVFKKKVESIGMELDMLRESPNGWLKPFPSFSTDNVCKMNYSVKYFEKCFTGNGDKETCTLHQGTHFIRNYTLEFDWKEATYGMESYGHYNFTFTFSGSIEGKLTIIGATSFLFWLKDEKNKKLEKKPKSNKGPKCNKYY